MRIGFVNQSQRGKAPTGDLPPYFSHSANLRNPGRR
jgi:hypothetical protein